MIQALVTFLVIVLVLAVVYWAVQKLVAASGIGLPPIAMTVLQIIFALLILIALINLIATVSGVSLSGAWK